VEVHNGQEGRGWAKVDIGGGHGSLEAKEDYQQQGDGRSEKMPAFCGRLSWMFM